MMPQHECWKVLTHDLRPPLQGGEPCFVPDAPFPITLGPVTLDVSSAECAGGLHYCTDLATAFRIAGLWPTGRPSRAFLVQPSADAITRGDKCRASQLTLLREATDAEIAAAIRSLSAPFGEHAEVMATEQIAWRRALARPDHDPDAVAVGLQAALQMRDLPWTLRRFDSAWAARAASDAWAARAARAAWDAWAARAARAAWAALTVQYTARAGWISYEPHCLTAGIRDAYAQGLEVALSTGPTELGWAMVP
jgi:hypothetical protein